MDKSNGNAKRTVKDLTPKNTTQVKGGGEVQHGDLQVQKYLDKASILL